MTLLEQITFEEQCEAVASWIENQSTLAHGRAKYTAGALEAMHVAELDELLTAFKAGDTAEMGRIIAKALIDTYEPEVQDMMDDVHRCSECGGSGGGPGELRCPYCGGKGVRHDYEG